jgi:hypothetical protein
MAYFLHLSYLCSTTGRQKEIIYNHKMLKLKKRGGEKKIKIN